MKHTSRLRKTPTIFNNYLLMGIFLWIYNKEKSYHWWSNAPSFEHSRDAPESNILPGTFKHYIPWITKLSLWKSLRPEYGQKTKKKSDPGKGDPCKDWSGWLDKTVPSAPEAEVLAKFSVRSPTWEDVILGRSLNMYRKSMFRACTLTPKGICAIGMRYLLITILII